MEEAFKLDERFGVVEVMGEWCLLEDGFSIGSQVAAGGAGLLASDVEHDEMSSANPVSQYELLRKVLQLRWADDNIQIWDRRISKPTRKKLKTMRGEKFYGGKLQQLQEGDDEDTSFGFKMCEGREGLGG